MIRVHGDYYDGRTSRAQPAELELQGGQARLTAPGVSLLLRLRELRVNERVGTTPRRVQFPDGGLFETADSDVLDAALAAGGAPRSARLLYRLESRWRYVAVALVAVVAVVWGLYRYGIPAAARAAAFALPPATSQAIGQGALELMDRALLAPSALDEATRTRVLALFGGIARELPQLRLALEFRRGRATGANAFALPSGTIVVTDELVRLSYEDGELVAVLAHEAGHVAHRHALRRAIQDSAVALFAIAVTGDVSTTSTLIAALPTMLAEMQYSQAFEREADDYALAYMRRHGLDPVHFASLLRRLERERHGDTDVPDWLSTHPASEERLRRFESAADR